ncbi:MAG: glutaredoxin family protein [Gammaproteobacteria bacterium]|nr:glutaredoxin family protein [Gammaproteobacteria bacterium]
MYGTSWCGYCAKARKLLDEHGITYFEYDIESSTEGYNQHKDLGGRGVPVFQIGGKVLKGYNPGKILQLVDALYSGMPKQTE